MFTACLFEVISELFFAIFHQKIALIGFLNTATRRLTTAIRSEKCVVTRIRRCANVIECTYANLDSTSSEFSSPHDADSEFARI